MTTTPDLDDRAHDWSGTDPVQEVFIDGYFKNATQAATAIFQAGEIMADYQLKCRAQQQRIAELEAELANHSPPYPSCETCGVQFVPQEEGQTRCEHHIESGIGAAP